MPKQIQATEIQNSKQYDLEQRTLQFPAEVMEFIRVLPKTIGNIEVIKQLVSSFSSVGANYIEANKALSKKDFKMRVKICRKESKESRYWLNLIEVKEEDVKKRLQVLIDEATQLMKLFGAIRPFKFEHFRSASRPNFCSCLIYQAQLPNKLGNYIFKQPCYARKVEIVEV